MSDIPERERREEISVEDLSTALNHEQEIQRLRRSRSAAKGNVTKKIKELTEWKMNCKSLGDANLKIKEFEDTVKNFYHAHEKYQAAISDEYDIIDSQEYLEIEKMRIDNFSRTLEEWLCSVENQPNTQVQISEVRPTDSVSNVGVSSRVNSRVSKVSKTSSTLSARLVVRAKKAALEAERMELMAQQALEREKLQVEQRTRELKLRTELAKVEAEERIYSQAMGAYLNPHIEHEDLDQDRKSEKKFQYQMKPNALAAQQRISSQSKQGLDPKDAPTTSHVGEEDQASSYVAEEFLRSMSNIQQQQQEQMKYMIDMQDRRDHQLHEVLTCHREMTASMSLPDVKVPILDGRPTEYCHFVRTFENLVGSKTSNQRTKLFYLVQYTSGEVKDLMRSCLMMKPDEGYTEARRLLKEKYGQDYRIATACVNRVIEATPIKSEDGIALQTFSVPLISCRNTLKEIGYLNRIENPDCLIKIIEKLPFSLRQRWREVADDITNNKSREINFDDIVKFVEGRVRVMNHPIFGKLTTNKSKDHYESKGRYSFGIDANESKKRKPEDPKVKSRAFKCPMCNGDHILPRCNLFRRESVEGLIKVARKGGLCFNCLYQGHMARTCPKDSFCKVTGCEVKHSTYLHPKPNTSIADKSCGPDAPYDPSDSCQPSSIGTTQQTLKNANNAQIDATGAGGPVIGLPLVPVKVKCAQSSKVVTTYAFLDSGSNTTFCTAELLRSLDVQGRETTLSLTTLNQENRMVKTSVISLEAFDLDESSMVELPTVFSTERLPISESSIPLQEDVKNWSHLEDINLRSVDTSIGLLVGNDVPQALEPRDIRTCGGKGPYAVKTILGWTINGPLGRNGTSRRFANFVRSDPALNEQFKKFCDMEFNDIATDSKLEMSVEDSRALGIMEGSAQLKEGHYEIALPWRNFPAPLPNNRPLAEHRLNHLRKRLIKDSKLFVKYAAVMEDLIKKGYARKVPESSMNQPQQPLWYLPHHPVLNRNKPGKVRIVFDCAAVFRDTSLNDQLLQGPDLTNSLVGVLLRFRENPIALTADIEAMFHQVRVAPNDCDALRFLWWPNNDLKAEPEEYQMVVHVFGATSSPSCANFALRKTAEDNATDFDPSIVKKNFYVDDCLKSVCDEEEGVEVARNLPKLLSRGGFHLTKWASNSAKVIDSIPESERASVVKDLDFVQPSMQRALGTSWDVVADVFTFNVTIKEKPPTRRGMLSIVSSVYDLIGLVAPFVLSAKILMQELCRENLNWDDPIPGQYLKRWNVWIKELPHIERLRVSRCIKPVSLKRITSAQFHIFADASECGFEAVSYLRFEDEEEKIHCSFIMAKSRVAPLKKTTIPRMELSAAVCAAKLEKLVRKKSDIEVESSVFWTDSTCVLGYLNSTTKGFQTFVANRVSTIRETSESNQWNHIPSDQNPADDVSRGLSADELLNCERWLKGPQFLWEPKDRWPRDNH